MIKDFKITFNDSEKGTYKFFRSELKEAYTELDFPKKFKEVNDILEWVDLYNSEAGRFDEIVFVKYKGKTYNT